jgi:tRNA A-37 threonylcarbamoyl transferase component Bud32
MQGIAFLHSFDVIHGELNVDNIYFSDEEECKIGSLYFL